MTDPDVSNATTPTPGPPFALRIHVHKDGRIILTGLGGLYEALSLEKMARDANVHGGIVGQITVAEEAGVYIITVGARYLPEAIAKQVSSIMNGRPMELRNGMPVFERGGAE